MKTKHFLIVLSVLFFTQASASCVDADGEITGPIFDGPSDMLPACNPDQVLSLKPVAQPAKQKKVQPEDDCRKANGDSKIGTTGFAELLPACK